MVKEMPIRLKLTLMVVGLMTMCCVGLTLILNFSANKMAEKINASIVQPAIQWKGEDAIEESIPLVETAPNTPVAEAQTTFKFESIFYMILVIAGGGVLTYYSLGKLLKPLNELSNKVKNINIDNLSEKLSIPSTKDEIVTLTQSFNDMTDKLHQSFTLQQNFAANAAHELKTPLSVLQTKVDVFKKKTIHTNHEYDELIHIFEKQIHRLRGLVKNLLEMTNENGNEKKDTICLSQVLKDIVSELDFIATEKNVQISLECDDISLVGNAQLLYGTLYNIVENGIKYNVEGGMVWITVIQLEPNRVSIQVKDTGMGIPQECKKDIFEPFFRVDTSRSRQMGGAGLGLSIVKNNLKKLNGTVTVTDNEDRGTCFEVIFNYK